MNNKLLLVTCITLLFRESQLTNIHENSSSLVREVISSIKLPEMNLGVGKEKEVMEGLQGTAIWMCNAPPDHKYELSEILQRLKMNVGDDEDLYNTISDGIVPEMNDASLKRLCLNLKRTLSDYFRECQVNEIISKAQYELKFNRSKIKNITQFISSVVTQLEPFQVGAVTKDPAVISDVDTSDTERMKSVFLDVQENNGGSTQFVTGWQCVNRMTGGGPRRGEEWIIPALQHNWKSGFSLSLFRQFAVYNIPKVSSPDKKPLMIRISFEDGEDKYFPFLYKAFKENETGQVFNLKKSKATPEEMAKYVQERLAVNGWHTRFMHVNPSMWTYKDVCNKIIELEAEGYEIQICMLDYLLKLPTAGCDQGPMGHDIRNMFERIRNFMMQRNILFITPHQLSTDAKQLVRDGRQDFVKHLPGMGMYAGSKQIDQVIDGEIFLHIEWVNDKAYLTIQKGKLRRIEQVPKDHHYAALPFLDGGVILDDINGPDSSSKKPGHAPLGSLKEGEDGVPWWSKGDDSPI